MIDRIKNFFKTNKLLKLISVVIAVIIWLIVVNVSNPEMKATFTTDIEIDYGESLTKLDKYYSLDTDSSRVSFSVRTSERNKVNASDFKVYVDMRDYSITGALPVYVTVSDNVKDIVSDVEVSPLVVHATTEDMQEKSFDLTVNIVGEPAEGYAVGPVDYTPSRVVLYGPNSEIGKISRIGFDIDVTGASDSVWGTAEFVYYDANDNQISADVRIVVKNSVSYFAPIYKKKTVSVSIQTTGNPAPGYSLDSVNVSPNFIEIYGADDKLDEVNAIILPSSLLNVSNATSDVSASIDISRYLPEGLYTETVSNIALVARISRMSIIAPILNDPNGALENPTRPNAGETESTTSGSNEENNENASSGNTSSGDTSSAVTRPSETSSENADAESTETESRRGETETQRDEPEEEEETEPEDTGDDSDTHSGSERETVGDIDEQTVTR